MTPSDPVWQALANEYGPEVQPWLDSLPALLERFERRWGLSALCRLPGATCSFVFECRSPRGTAVLKLCPPHPQFTPEIPALEAFAPYGGVPLWEQDSQALAMLMPRLEPGANLSLLTEHEALQVACRLMRSLRDAPLPSVPNLSTWYEPLWMPDAPAYGIDPAMIADARDLSKHLIQTTKDPVLLHGDLHHFNILNHGEDWVAIDPKGVVGDAAFEPTGFMRNPIDTVDLDPSASQRRILTFANALGCDPYRVWGWAFCQTVLCCWWDGAVEADTRWYRLAQVLWKMKP